MRIYKDDPQPPNLPMYTILSKSFDCEASRPFLLAIRDKKQEQRSTKLKEDFLLKREAMSNTSNHREWLLPVPIMDKKFVEPNCPSNVPKIKRRGPPWWATIQLVYRLFSTNSLKLRVSWALQKQSSYGVFNLFLLELLALFLFFSNLFGFPSFLFQ